MNKMLWAKYILLKYKAFLLAFLVSWALLLPISTVTTGIYIAGLDLKTAVMSATNAYLLGDWPYQGIVILLGATIALVLAITLVLGYASIWNLNNRQIEGPKLIPFSPAGSQKLKRMIASEERRVYKAHPKSNFYYAPARETGHMCVIGAPGSGKTQFLKPFVEMQRASKLKHGFIIYDNKGDFTETFKDIPGHDVILCAPWDKRSFIWQVGKDINTRQLAREFAAKLIPDSEEPIYSNSARSIIAGLIFHLQETNGNDWTFSNLTELLGLPREQLYKTVLKADATVAELIREQTKLSQNILTNISAFMGPINDLALAWSHGGSTFSVTDLVMQKKPFTLILQGSGLYKDMASGLIRAVIATFAANVETLPDSQDQRRLWFVFDEFPQLGHLDSFMPLMEIGRSKGCAVIIAMQDINQATHIYGPEQTKTIMSMCRTHIYGRVGRGDTAEFLSEICGQKTVERMSPNIDAKGKLAGMRTIQEKLPLITANYIIGSLGAKRKHIDMLLSGFQDDIYQMRIGYTQYKKVRSKNVWADWATPLSGQQSQNDKHTTSTVPEFSSATIDASENADAPTSKQFEMRSIANKHSVNEQSSVII